MGTVSHSEPDHSLGRRRRCEPSCSGPKGQTHCLPPAHAGDKGDVPSVCTWSTLWREFFSYLVTTLLSFFLTTHLIFYTSALKTTLTSLPSDLLSTLWDLLIKEKKIYFFSLHNRTPYKTFAVLCRYCVLKLNSQIRRGKKNEWFFFPVFFDIKDIPIKVQGSLERTREIWTAATYLIPHILQLAC